MSDRLDEFVVGPAKLPGTLLDYVRLARLDHSTKHIFIIPGIVLAWLLRGVRVDRPLMAISLGFLTAFCIASANYVINEWLDRDFDRFHPRKFQRSAVRLALRGAIVWGEWAVLLCIGLVLAGCVGQTMLVIASAFALQGVVYNAPPLRLKDKPYLDVLSESVNNPLRLMIGWAMIDPGTLPPSSIIFMYWTGGAFLMAAKRLSEFREIARAHGRERLVQYRRSFAGYSETSLMMCCFVYALFSIFFMAIFLVKYRIEYLLTAPIVIALFADYMVISLQPDSTAQRPERLFREPSLILLVALLAAAFILATLIDIPPLNTLTTQQFITIQ